jgi:hypothetical protein
MENQKTSSSKIRFKFLIFVLLIGMFMIANCSDDSHLEMEETATFTNVSTGTAIPSRTATLTFTPSPTATIFPTIVMERDGYDLVMVDIRIQSQIPDDVELHGGLITRGLVDRSANNNKALNLQTGSYVPLNDFECSPPSVLVSPNNEYIYIQCGDPNPDSKDFYVVENTITKEITKFDWDKEVGWDGIWGWISDEDLLVTTDAYTANYPPHFIAFNPFTGEQVNLPSDLPELGSFYPIPRQSWPIYNKSKEFVLYPTYLENGFDIILYDIAKAQNIKQYALGRFSDVNGPAWSHDGEQFFLVSYMFESPVSYHIGDIDGSYTTIAEFTNEIPGAGFWEKIWSPNDQYILFTVYDYGAEEDRIYIIDIEKERIIDAGITYTDGNQLKNGLKWAPDSTQFLFVDGDASVENEVIVFDIPSMQAFKILDDTEIYAWIRLE